MIGIEHSDGRQIEYEALQFSGGERHVSINLSKDKTRSSASPIRIRANITNSDDLIDFALICSAVQAEYQAPIEIELPYLPYARQDRVCAPGQANSLSLMKAIMGFVPNAKRVSWDTHSQIGIEALGITNVTVVEMLSAIHQASTNDAFTSLLNHPNTVIIAPDYGAVRRAKAVADQFGVRCIVCSKHRDPASGKIDRYDVPESIDGSHALIIDDICDGGATFCLAATDLRQHGAADVSLWVTHGIFSKGVAPLREAGIRAVYTTSSRPDRAIFPDYVKTYAFRYDFNLNKIALIGSEET